MNLQFILGYYLWTVSKSLSAGNMSQRVKGSLYKPEDPDVKPPYHAELGAVMPSGNPSAAVARREAKTESPKLEGQPACAHTL